MTNEDMQIIADMIANAVNTKTATEAPVSDLAAQPEQPVIIQPTASPTPVQPAPSVPQVVPTTPQAAEKHVPACSPEQVRDILNDSRLEVRVQAKYPLVSALEEAFKNPAARAIINGKDQPLISADQMRMIVETLKKSGKYWPQVVTTILDAKGDRMYVNTSYKREDGLKWKLGSVLQKLAGSLQK